MAAERELLSAPIPDPAGLAPGTEAFDIRRYWNSRHSVLGPLGIMAAVGVISLLHYQTSVHLFLLHEILKRLYYVPIVIAAIAYGTIGGVATAMFASLVYLPHIVLDWQVWPLLEVEQYSELILFHVVAAVTGVLANRLRAERNRSQDVAAALQEACRHLESRIEERLRVDRLVTVGRIASGIAHEIKNPLGGLLGCIEILESEFPRADPKWEFFSIARKEMRRLDAVVTEFLQFAEPAPPSSQTISLNEVVEGASRLARPSLVGRGVTIHLQPSAPPLFATADAQQVQRAVLNLMLAGASEVRDARVDSTILQSGNTPAILIRIAGAGTAFGVADLFDPFPASAPGHGLALATAQRLVENQHGSLRAERIAGALQFVVHLPPASQEARSSSAAGKSRRNHDEALDTRPDDHGRTPLGRRFAFGGLAKPGE